VNGLIYLIGLVVVIMFILCSSACADAYPQRNSAPR
jgi:hypothetical protein